MYPCGYACPTEGFVNIPRKWGYEIERENVTMKTFEYTITEEVGIHARPAGMLSREGKKFKSAITVVNKDGKSANILRLMALMGLGVKCGETVTVSVEGEDEAAAFEGIKAFFEANL